MAKLGWTMDMSIAVHLATTALFSTRGKASSAFCSRESCESFRREFPSDCSSASSFMCSRRSILNSASVRATSSLSRRSMSANNVANVRPVSSAFFVPFCDDETTSQATVKVTVKTRSTGQCILPPRHVLPGSGSVGSPPKFNCFFQWPIANLP